MQGERDQTPETITERLRHRWGRSPIAKCGGRDNQNGQSGKHKRVWEPAFRPYGKAQTKARQKATVLRRRVIVVTHNFPLLVWLLSFLIVNTLTGVGWAVNRQTLPLRIKPCRLTINRTVINRKQSPMRVAPFAALLYWAVLPLASPLAVAAPAYEGIAMHGTPKYPAGFAHFDYVNPTAPKGGVQRLAATGTFDSFNAFIIKGEPEGHIGMIYDTLMVQSADEPFSQYGLLAASVETPEDRSWVIFRLRPEARFSDGTPVTAADVVWTFNTQMDKGTPSFQSYYADVAAVTALDPLTVKFSFKPGPHPELPLDLGQMVVLPAHAWAGKDFTAASLAIPVGSGPYRLKSFEAGRSAVYERRADYWGKDLAVTRGFNNFDEIRIDYYRDLTVEREAFKGGAFDIWHEFQSKAWHNAYDIPAVKEGRLKKQVFPESRTEGMQGFAFNLRRPLFSDPKVREALAYAFDFEGTNATLFYGSYVRTRSYFDNSELAATGLPSPEELKILEPLRASLPPRVFTEEYNPPSTKADGAVRANLKTALALLAEAGWVVKDQKLLNATTGAPFVFEILLDQPVYKAILLSYGESLKRLGIEVTLRLVDSAQYHERLKKFDFDMVMERLGESESPGPEQRDQWSSLAADSPDSGNTVGIKNPAIDALIEGLTQARDRQDLVTRVHALDRALQWSFLMVPNWHVNGDWYAWWDKFGMPEVIPKQGVQPGTWWYDPAKDAALKQAAGNGKP